MELHYGNSRYVTNIGNHKNSTWRIIGVWISLIIGTAGCLTIVSLLAYIGSQLAISPAPIAKLCFFTLAINLVSLFLFLMLAWQYRFNSGSRLPALVYVSLTSLALSTGLSLACAIWMQTTATSQNLLSNVTSFVVALIVLTVLSTTSQLIFLRLMSFDKPTSPQEQPLTIESLPEISIISRPATSKTQDTVQSNPFSTQSGTTSPRFSISAISIHSLPSRKNSKVYSRPSSSMSESSQLDFHWDTSSVPATLRDTVHRNIPSKLPPIPGSRPVSPAKALDGPFLPPSPHPNQSQPTSPTEDTPFFPVIDTEPAYPEAAAFLPPNPPFAGSSSQSIKSYSPTSPTPKQISRCPSIVSFVESVSHLATQTGTQTTEGHIHPLFRSDSSDPAPSASKKTIVTAASVIDAEHIVNSNRMVSRPSSSKPTSPLAQAAEWQPFDNCVTDTLSPPLHGDLERSSSVASDIIILPSLPRASTSSRPSTSINSSDT